MTGLGAGDVGPTGDLQVLVDDPEPESVPAQVGLRPSYCTIKSVFQQKILQLKATEEKKNPSLLI